TSCTTNKLDKIVQDYDIGVPLRLSTELNQPHTPPHCNASFSDAILRCDVVY
ncbi:hypothetical protein TorRG33x02_083070, partial [Trema orientale]